MNFLTVTEVAERLRVSKMTVYRLIEDGQIEHHRFGRSIRITEEALKEFVRRSNEAARPAPPVQFS